MRSGCAAVLAASDIGVGFLVAMVENPRSGLGFFQGTRHVNSVLHVYALARIASKTLENEFSATDNVQGIDSELDSNLSTKQVDRKGESSTHSNQCAR